MYIAEPFSYGVERYREMLQKAERRRSGRYEGWHLSKAWEAARRAVELLVQFYQREGERCLAFQPACEMGFG
jgi:hypothetical protein